MKPAAERYGTLVSCLRLAYLLYNCVPVRSTPSRRLLVFVFGQWQSDSDQLGEIRGRIRGIGALINEAARFEFGKWKSAGDDEVALIQQFVAFAIEQDAPIPRHALVGWMLRADARSAVGGDGVIPARFVPQSVERMDVFKETFARVRWRNGRAVKIDILLAVVCSHADHVALIGHDVDELELPVEPADSRVGLAKLLARLDGEAERRRVSELEAGDGMRDPGRAPVIDREIDAGDLRDAHRARLPMGGVVGLGPVVAVAYVVQRYFVALNVGPSFLRHIRLPVAIVGRRKRQPPDEHESKANRDQTHCAPATLDEK